MHDDFCRSSIFLAEKTVAKEIAQIISAGDNQAKILIQQFNAVIKHLSQKKMSSDDVMSLSAHIRNLTMAIDGSIDYGGNMGRQPMVTKVLIPYLTGDGMVAFNGFHATLSRSSFISTQITPPILIAPHVLARMRNRSGLSLGASISAISVGIPLAVYIHGVAPLPTHFIIPIDGGVLLAEYAAHPSSDMFSTVAIKGIRRSGLLVKWQKMQAEPRPVIMCYTFLSNEQIYGTKEKAAEKSINFGKKHALAIADYFLSSIFPQVGPDGSIAPAAAPSGAAAVSLKEAMDLVASIPWQRFAYIKSSFASYGDDLEPPDMEDFDQEGGSSDYQMPYSP
jgi:hypothetical protein